jgi:hypothetical protein
MAAFGNERQKPYTSANGTYQTLISRLNTSALFVLLALAAVASLTFVPFEPALAVGLCSNYPNLDGCPFYGVYGEKATPPVLSSPVPPRHIRHVQSYHGHYLHRG